MGASRGRACCGSRAALAAALLAACTGFAQAQFSLLADEIELKRLDHHPRGSFVVSPRLRFYGALDMGLRSGGVMPDRRDCEPRVRARTAGPGPSYIGLRGTETLDFGWRAELRLEGYGGTACRLYLDRESTVGIAHRLWGELKLGRAPQPAWDAALLADPWRGTSVATAGEDRFYLRPAGAGSILMLRTDQAATYTSPDLDGWVVTLQRQLGRSDPQTLGAPGASPLGIGLARGLSAQWRRGALTAAAGYQRWNRATEALPIAATWVFGHWQGHAGFSSGHWEGRAWRNLLIGATITERSGPRPGQWRVAGNVHRCGGREQWQLGAGYRMPLSARTSLQANVASGGGNATCAAAAPGSRADLGLRHEFSL